MSEEPRPEAADDGDEGPIGPFPSWNAVYFTVILATAAMTLVLYVFTVALDFSQ